MSSLFATFQRRFFYGWVIIFALFIVHLITAGIRFTFGPAFKPMLADLGVDRASLSLVFSLNMLLYGIVQPALGQVVDRYGPKGVMVLSSLILAVSLVGMSFATSLWQLFLFYGVLAAIGLSGTGTVTVYAVIARWFVKWRGTMMSIVASAGMGGQLLMVPLAQFLILLASWQRAYQFLAIPILFLIVPLSMWVVKGKPEDMGLAPDGIPSAKPSDTGSKGQVGERTGLLEAMNTQPFWLLGCSFFTCGFSISLVAAHLIAMLTDRGFLPMVASTALGLLGGSSMVGMIAIGAISDRFGRKNLLGAIYLVRGLGLLLLFVVHTPPQLYILGLIVGLGWAGTGSMTSALTADLYGRLSLGSIFSWFYLAHQVGAALGPYIGGLSSDRTGGYFPAFLLTSTILFVASALCFTIRERPGQARVSPAATSATL